MIEDSLVRRPSTCSLVVFFLDLLGALLDSTLLNLVQDDLVGIFEGLLETGVEGVEAIATHSFLGAASLGLLVLEEGSAGGLAGLGSDNLVGTVGLGEGVELLHHVAVLERVLLGLVMETLDGLDSDELGLDLV